jgi:excisionase family DNA binding protein
VPEDVTTTTAAKLLGVSRPTLMKMIAGGDLPSHKVGTHARLKADQVLAFKRARLARQRKAFDELLDLEDDDWGFSYWGMAGLKGTEPDSIVAVASFIADPVPGIGRWLRW